MRFTSVLMADLTSPTHLKSDSGAPANTASPDWIVAVSTNEIERGELTPDNDGRARVAMHEHGCVLLRGAFPPAIVEAMQREYVSQFGALDLAGMRDLAAKPPPNRIIQVGGVRYDIALRMTGAFGRTEVFANRLLLKFLHPMLGVDMHLNSFTAVVSHPNAPQQRSHRDYPHLFFEPGVGLDLTPHAVNVVVPLIDVDMQTGPTGVWPGSHRLPQSSIGESEPITACELRRGDLMLLDYRTLHAGLPNMSERARPIIYMVYARPWFFDLQNHLRVSRIPLDMPMEHYDKLPPSVHPLLARALYYAVLARGREGDARGDAVQRPARAPSGGVEVGRNDPCPCGSLKKYKHCHGSLI
jgi:hypothetical protein